ncbi:MAG: hypothetical protein KME60_17930 [Cyanomargarita calcarea GSE-NOS-MK-12-04C]|uniref:FdxN element excision controlling factor protein n=1 Tax=Cyanomargarita calcarea GSE-NOS-MK-12-04C TaxID=2839659 RepID=A0A951QNM0_9CYAN|nr:hypothetical protein [Cyanomargarita calcarea GSE-NOS-MK-12-04C]
MAAERDGEKIAVEIKSFVGSSNIYEFHTALGQFINYRTALSQKQPERQLYLAVPRTIYLTFFKLELIELVVQSQNLKLLIYDPELEVIEQWAS